MTNSRLIGKAIGLLVAAAAFAGAGTAAAQSAYEDPDPVPAYADDPDARTVYADESDATIDDRVRFSLEQALGEDRAEDISVRTVDGIVYLGGQVPTENERRIAQDAVYRVEGVRGLRVANLLARTYDYDDDDNPYRY